MLQVNAKSGVVDGALAVLPRLHRRRRVLGLALLVHGLARRAGCLRELETLHARGLLNEDVGFGACTAGLTACTKKSGSGLNTTIRRECEWMLVHGSSVLNILPMRPRHTTAREDKVVGHTHPAKFTSALASPTWRRMRSRETARSRAV
jgi:hypothetical protein